MLNNEIYIGNTVSLKRGTRSHRDNRAYKRDESEWIRVENTHAPLVSTEIWDKVQAINHAAKAKPTNIKPPRPNPFAGLLVCLDCNTKMNRLGKTYLCSTYQRSGNAVCTPHKISERNLKVIVLAQIKNLAEKISLDENTILKKIRIKLISAYKSERTNTSKQRKDLEQQLHKLELQIDRLYEDKIAGQISTETFSLLVANLDKKREEVESKLSASNQAKKQNETKLADIDRWVSLIKEKAVSLFTQGADEEADRETLTALIEKIEIGEKHVTDGQTHQDVRIFYKTVGNCANNL